MPPHRCVTLYRYYYRLCERSVQELAAPVSKYRQQYMLLTNMKQADRSLMADDLVKHTSTIREYIWNELSSTVYHEVEGIHKFTGWWVPLSCKPFD